MSEFQKGYEFVNGEPVLRPDFGWEEMREVATNPMVSFGRLTVTVPKGKTAYNPASTKRVIYGPCTVTYEFDRAGINAVVR